MKGYSIVCAWLKVGETDICGRSCCTVYCKIHLAKIRKGRGIPVPCRSCGYGVQSEIQLCRDCGRDRLPHRHIALQKCWRALRAGDATASCNYPKHPFRAIGCGVYTQSTTCLLSKSCMKKLRVTGWGATRLFASPAWSNWSLRPAHQYFLNMLCALWTPGAIQPWPARILTTDIQEPQRGAST